MYSVTGFCGDFVFLSRRDFFVFYCGKQKRKNQALKAFSPGLHRVYKVSRPNYYFFSFCLSLRRKVQLVSAVSSGWSDQGLSRSLGSGHFTLSVKCANAYRQKIKYNLS